MLKGWIQLKRSEDTFELLKFPRAFIVLTIIALRARRNSKSNINGLEKGEALIGDHNNYGLTRSQHRYAVNTLKNLQLITTRTTNKGTVAKLCQDRIYDINPEQRQPPEQPPDNHQTAIAQPSGNHQTATNNNYKNYKNYKKTTTNNIDELVLCDFSDVLKKQFSRIGLTERGIRKLYLNCDKNQELMLKWIVWGRGQRNASNVAGLILSQSSRGGKVGLSHGQKSTFDYLVRKMRVPFARRFQSEVKRIAGDASAVVCQRIIYATLGDRLPKNDQEVDMLIKAVKSGRFDLKTGKEKP